MLFRASFAIGSSEAFPPCYEYLTALSAPIFELGKLEFTELDKPQKLVGWSPTISENGKLVAFASAYGIHIFDLQSGKQIDLLLPHPEAPIAAVNFIGNDFLAYRGADYSWSKIYSLGRHGVIASAVRDEEASGNAAFLTYDPLHDLIFMREGTCVVGRTPSGKNVVTYDFGGIAHAIGTDFHYLPESKRIVFTVIAFTELKNVPGSNRVYPNFFSVPVVTEGFQKVQLQADYLIREELPREEINFSREDYDSTEGPVPFETMYRLRSGLSQPSALEVYVDAGKDSLALSYTMGRGLETRTQIFLRSADGTEPRGSLRYGGGSPTTARLSPGKRYLAIGLVGGSVSRQIFLDREYATFATPSVVIFDLQKPYEPLVALETSNTVQTISWTSPTQLYMGNNDGNLYVYDIPAKD